MPLVLAPARFKRVTNGIPLGCLLSYRFTVNCVQTLKAAPFIGQINEILVQLAMKVSGDILIIVLETLHMIAPVHPQITVQYEAKLLPLATACFIKYNDQPFVMDAVQDLIYTMAKMPEMVVQVQARLLPTLVSVVQQHENPAYLGLVERGVELIKQIAEASPAGPFSPALMTQAFPALLKMMLTSADQEVRCAFFDRNPHSRMPLGSHACSLEALACV
jgi:hypothetical protein